MLKPIVFFDGYCGLCNKSIDFLLRKDSRKKLRYSTIQGEIAKQILPDNLRLDMNTFAFYKNGRIYQKSTAAIFTLAEMGSFWKLTLVLWLIPKIIRDWAYTQIAKRRYKFWGMQTTCRIPSQEERDLFLA